MKKGSRKLRKWFNVGWLLWHLVLSFLSFLVTYFILSLFGVKNPWISVSVNVIWYVIVKSFSKGDVKTKGYDYAVEGDNPQSYAGEDLGDIKDPRRHGDQYEH